MGVSVFLESGDYFVLLVMDITYEYNVPGNIVQDSFLNRNRLYNVQHRTLINPMSR